MTLNKKNLIVTLVDANFIDQAKQLFSSVYFNAGWSGEYLLLACGVSESDLSWFRLKGILIYECSFLTNLPVGTSSYPPVVLSKFYLFKEYFKQWQKIIFLDADIIVRAPLDSLLELSGFNAPEASTIHLEDEFLDSKYLTPQFKKKYRLSGKAFNTGILVFDTNIIESNTFSDLLNLYQEFKNISRFNEESILNIYFYHNWNLLSIIYNSTPWIMRRFYKVAECKMLAVIIHFVCIDKPWNNQSLYFKEWTDNLARAEEINLDCRPLAIKYFSDSELYRYTKYIKKIDFINSIYEPFYIVDKKIGRLGLSIAENYPQLYKLINLKRFFKWRLVDKIH